MRKAGAYLFSIFLAGVMNPVVRHMGQREGSRWLKRNSVTLSRREKQSRLRRTLGGFKGDKAKAIHLLNTGYSYLEVRKVLRGY